MKEKNLLTNCIVDQVTLAKSSLLFTPMEDSDPKDQEWLLKFREVVRPILGNFDLDLDMISKELLISKSHLNRKTNKLLGLSPMQYVQELRYIEARKMLVEKRYTLVKTVALSVGFKSRKVFSRNFKKRFGKYPSEYL